ncbi:MAG: ribokinase [Deltaproteobacteria bacterium]|nr:ribokinase [Deltaproteobacteria bacterium]
MEEIDYLCIGHVSQDLSPDGPSAGGTATYSSLTAQTLGQRAAIVTSAGPDFDPGQFLPGIKTVSLPTAHTTVFENIYTPAGRCQYIHSVAAPLGPEAVPPDWRSPGIVHLGPIANEVDPALIYLFDSAVVGLTPQGWHRGWDAQGRVRFIPWPAAFDILPLATAVVVSQEDIRGQETWDIYRRRCRLLVITQGAAGCIVCHKSRVRHFPAPKAPEIDPTGVGDIFAAAFFVRLHETDGDPWEAARFATQVAAPSVARPGLAGVPGPESE